MTAPLFMFAGRRVRMVEMASRHRIVQMTPMSCSEWSKPILSSSCRMIMGNRIPPMPPAVRARLVARARRCMNQCPTETIAGVNMREQEKPPRIPQSSIYCQYSGIC